MNEKLCNSATFNIKSHRHKYFYYNIIVTNIAEARPGPPHSTPSDDISHECLMSSNHGLDGEPRTRDEEEEDEGYTRL